MTVFDPGEILPFLEKAGWADAERVPLAGDASSRAYERLSLPSKAAILMKDPSSENMQRFVKITGILRQAGYSAPDIYAEDVRNGLLLLEDFDDRLLTQCIAAGASEKSLYSLAVDFLIDVRARKWPDSLPYFSASYVLDQNVLFLDWFIPAQTGKKVPQNARLFYQQIWQQLLKPHDHLEEGLLLRDFHAENILYLKDRAGLKSLGLIDYQDAMIGPAAYDLVSLLQDARRDVPWELEEEMIQYYVAQTGVNDVEFRELYAILGAHRSLRILGIFTRLAEQEGAVKYDAFMPRVKTHLRRNLAQPALLALDHWLALTLGKETL
ncbi:MAG: phosphotransferase [Sneathiella sp.]